MSRPGLVLAALLLALVLTEGASVPWSFAQGAGVRIDEPRAVDVAPRPPGRRVPGYYNERPPRTAVQRRPMARDELTASLHARGFSDVVFLQQRGATYIYEATGQRGERVRLIVNSVTGGIDGVRQLGVGRKK